MTTITIHVPDGDTCNGCEYKSRSGYETSNRTWVEEETCMIFRNKIKHNKKCIGCRLCANSAEEKNNG